jgi:predicted alpha/beta-hydrolase family hydrolase
LDCCINGPEQAALTLVLAHGAGAGMDTPFMEAFATGLGQKGWQVVLFDFSYMAARRSVGAKRPPPGQATLLTEWQAAIVTTQERLRPRALVIGGKSLGGRMASLIADNTAVAGLLCLGYPFHPPGRPERLRTAHLKDLATATLILQGSRDPLGSRKEVAAYALSSAIRLHWVEDGDHNLTPRKRSGRSRSEAWAEGIDAIDRFFEDLGQNWNKK